MLVRIRWQARNSLGRIFRSFLWVLKRKSKITSFWEGFNQESRKVISILEIKTLAPKAVISYRGACKSRPKFNKLRKIIFKSYSVRAKRFGKWLRMELDLSSFLSKMGRSICMSSLHKLFHSRTEKPEFRLMSGALMSWRRSKAIALMRISSTSIILRSISNFSFIRMIKFGR